MNSYISNKAIFLDRDGVINDNAKFTNKASKLKFIPGIFDFCRSAVENGYLLIVVTNQGGLAAGFTSPDDQKKIAKIMWDRFTKENCKLTAYMLCPHLPPEHKSLVDNKKKVESLIKPCACRKPNPGMIIESAEQFGVDLSKSHMVGDMPTDIEAGINAGIPKENCHLFNGEIYPSIS